MLAPALSETPPPPPPNPGVLLTLALAGLASRAGQVGAGAPSSQVPLVPELERILDLRARVAGPVSTIVGALTGSMSRSGSGLAGPAQRLLRAAFFDRETYRGVATDSALHNEAWAILLVLSTLKTYGFDLFMLNKWLLHDSVRNMFDSLEAFVNVLSRLRAIITGPGVEIIAMLVFVGVVAGAGKRFLGIETGPRPMFRALVYSQGLLAATLLMGDSVLIHLWAFVAAVAAVHDVTGADTARSTVLVVAGSVARALVARALSGFAIIGY